jgi:hypothetical protein
VASPHRLRASTPRAAKATSPASGHCEHSTHWDGTRAGGAVERGARPGDRERHGRLLRSGRELDASGQAARSSAGGLRFGDSAARPLRTADPHPSPGTTPRAGCCDRPVPRPRRGSSASPTPGAALRCSAGGPGRPAPRRSAPSNSRLG